VYSSTHPLPAGRAVEVSAKLDGSTLVLRARFTHPAFGRMVVLVENGDARKPGEVDRAVAHFTAQLDDFTGLKSLRLFPEDLLHVAA
jgi:hypothetical protein